MKKTEQGSGKRNIHSRDSSTGAEGLRHREIAAVLGIPLGENLKTEDEKAYPIMLERLC
jgi:hypothetical protein